MVRSTPRPARAAAALAVAAVALGLVARPESASGQNTFNPYMPYNSQYYSYVVPSIPNNVALPGAVRDLQQYGAEENGNFNSSRFNSFDRWAAEYDADVSGRRSGGTRGTSSGRLDLSRDRAYAPVREAERKFQKHEEERDRIAIQRDNYFAAASRTKDPARKAAYLRVVARLADPKTAATTLREIDDAMDERQSAAEARAEGRSTAPSARAPRPPASIAAPPAGTGNGAARPAVTPSPAAGTTAPAARAATPVAVPSPAPAAGAPSRRSAPDSILPDRRPPMDSEIRSRAPSIEHAPPPPPGIGPLVAPDPLPDDPPAAPR